MNRQTWYRMISYVHDGDSDNRLMECSLIDSFSVLFKVYLYLLKKKSQTLHYYNFDMIAYY